MKKPFTTYTSGPVTVVQLKQLRVSDAQRGVHQHVQTGELALEDK